MDHVIFLNRFQQLRRDIICRKGLSIPEYPESFQGGHGQYALLALSTVGVATEFLLANQYALKGGGPIGYKRRFF